jgi:hypothetical protein
MHPKTLLIALLFTAVPILQCQAQTQPGYIITLNGDTLSGLIENNGEVHNSQICQFQGSGQSEAVEYLPGAISGYGFSEGSYYESKTIVLDGSEQLVFVQCLVKGAASLYYYRNKDGEFYFLDKVGSEMLALTKEKNRYIRLLKASFSDCMEIQASIDKVSLSHRSLISITCKYNDCVGKGEESVTYEQGSRIRLGFGPVVGFSASRISLMGDALFESFNFETSNDPVIGVLLDVGSSRLGNHLSLQLGSEVSQVDFYAYHEETNSIYTAIDYYYDVYLQGLSLKLYGGPKYSFTSGRIRPNLGGGLLLHKYFQTDFWYVEETHIVDLVTTEEWRHDIVSNLFYGAYFQAGVDVDLTQRMILFINIKGGYAITNPQTILYQHGSSSQIRIRSELISIGFNLGILF